MDIREKTFNVVRLRDLEKFIKETYGLAPEIEATEEWGRDGMYDFKVDGELDKWQLKAWNWGRPDCRVCLNKLCADGHIPEGTYLVEVCR